MNLDSLLTKLRNQLTTWVPWMNTKLAHYYLYAQYTQSRDKKVDIELVCFFQSEKNAGALSCVLICILLILSASVTPKKRATYTLPSLFFFNPSLSRICWWKPCQCGNSRLRRRVCVSGTLTCPSDANRDISSTRAHTHRNDGRCFNGRW